MAIYDARGNQDFDLDFIADNVDVDIDGDKLKLVERYYGTDIMNKDTDGDGVLDPYDVTL